MNETTTLEITEDEDGEAMMEALLHLREGADMVIDQSEKRGGSTESGGVIIPFDLDDGITVVVIKRFDGGATH